MVEEKEEEITEALHKDLSRPQQESFLADISMIKDSCKLALEDLKQWMKPEKAETSVATYPSSAEIVSKPLGVVLAISPWNIPLGLSLDPVIGAIAVGNVVVLKPSEISPATSSLLAKLLQEYLDNSTIRVVQGAVPKTSALLDQKWNKIFYTGITRVGRIIMAASLWLLLPNILLLLSSNSEENALLLLIQRSTYKRIVAGKWTNCGQTCIAVDYVLTTKEFAPKLIDALKNQMEEFYGKNPMKSKDLSRIGNSFHFKSLTNLLDEDKVSHTIVYGGQRDETQLYKGSHMMRWIDSVLAKGEKMEF